MTLTKAQITKFKAELEKMRAQMLRVLEGAEAEVKRPDEATGYSQHQADQGTDDFDRTIGLQLTSQEYDILKQIDRALQKITEGTYGICDISGENIPIKRLEAMPYANLTVASKERMERGEV